MTAPWITDDQLDEVVDHHRRVAGPDPRRVRRARLLGVVFGVLVAAIALLVCVGWALDIPTLTRVLPGLATMKMWTALGLLTIGVSLAALNTRLAHAPTLRRAECILGGATAAFVGLIGSAMLGETVTGTNWGFDNLFGLDVIDLRNTAHPGRLSVGTQVAFVTIGLSLWCLVRGRVRLGQAFAFATLANGLIALLGFVLGVQQLYRVVAFSSMALHTAVSVLLSGLALLMVRVEAGQMVLFTGNTAGGIIARRLLPLMVLGPVLAGGVVRLGISHNWFDAKFGVAMTATVLLMLGVLALLYQANRLRAVDLRRAGAEELLSRVRAAEADRDQAMDDLRTVNEGLEHFAAVAAHDLKSPLASIAMLAEDLVDETAAAGTATNGNMGTVRAATAIRTAAMRGLTLVDDLLEFSRSEATALSMGPVDLHRLASEVGDEQQQIAGRPCHIEIGALPEVVADAARLRHVFSNLIGNALKYCPDEREPRVRIDYANERDGMVSIRVADNGVGVPEGERERVFMMFQRGTRTSAVRGTGVGLPICRRVVERHGGTISVHPNTPIGSVFVFTLPVAGARQDAVEQSSPAASAGAR